MNYLNIFQDACNSRLLTKLKIRFDEYRNNILWIIVTKYCDMNNIPVIYKLREDINIDRLKNELIEINCFVDICQVNQLYKKLAKTIFQCLSSCDFNDLRKNRQTSVKLYIEYIFSILNLYLANCKYFQEYYLSYIFSEIFTAAFKYTSKSQNENYIDLVIQYVTKYNLPSEDFFNLFLTGLNKDDFVLKFKNIQLEEGIKNIDDKETIKNLINKLIQRKKKKKKSKKTKNSEKNKEIKNQPEIKDIKLSESLSKNDESKDIQDSSNKSINLIENEEIKKRNNLTDAHEKEDNKVKKQMQKSVSNNDSNKYCESSKLKDDFNVREENSINSLDALQKEISNLRIKYSELEKANITMVSNLQKEKADMNSQLINMNSKIINMDDEISNLKEEINDLNDENGNMQSEISSLNLKVKKANEDECKLNKLIEIISFRDLTKRMLDNMIEYVEDKDKKIFNGISKRKEKLKIINEKFNFKDIQYMQRAIDELKEKYYNSNILSHVPDYVQSIQEKPYGLISDPEGRIAKKYYKIMIESKDERVLDFMINHLYIKKEIKSIYFDKK